MFRCVLRVPVRKSQIIRFSDSETKRIRELTDSTLRSPRERLALRALLLMAEGQTNKSISAKLRVSQNWLGKLRKIAGTEGYLGVLRYLSESERYTRDARLKREVETGQNHPDVRRVEWKRDGWVTRMFPDSWLRPTPRVKEVFPIVPTKDPTEEEIRKSLLDDLSGRVSVDTSPSRKPEKLSRRKVEFQRVSDSRSEVDSHPVYSMSDEDHRILHTTLFAYPEGTSTWSSRELASHLNGKKTDHQKLKHDRVARLWARYNLTPNTSKVARPLLKNLSAGHIWKPIGMLSLPKLDILALGLILPNGDESETVLRVDGDRNQCCVPLILFLEMISLRVLKGRVRVCSDDADGRKRLSDFLWALKRIHHPAFRSVFMLACAKPGGIPMFTSWVADNSDWCTVHQTPNRSSWAVYLQASIIAANQRCRVIPMFLFDKIPCAGQP
jgi:hypothetical protein